MGYYLFESNFESGDATDWSAGETDTEGRLSIDHYVALATKYPFFSDPLPYRGSYLLHGDLSVSGTVSSFLEDVTLATALAGTVWLRFYVQVTTDLVMAASDRMTLAVLSSAGPVDEVAVCLRNNAGQYEILVSETSAGATVVASPLVLGQWHRVELRCVIDSGVGNDGRVDFYFDSYLLGSLTAINQAAITSLRMGILGKDAGTTAGHVFFDGVVGHTSQIGGHRVRNEEVMTVTKSIFLAQGPGCVDEYALTAGAGQDDHMSLYDADIQTVLAGADKVGPDLGGVTPFGTVIGPRRKIYFNRGLYVLLSGTSPVGTVKFGARQESVQPLLQYASRRSTRW